LGGAMSELDSRIPPGQIGAKWASPSRYKLVNPATSGSTTSSSSARAWPALRPRQRWESSLQRQVLRLSRLAAGRTPSRQGGINAAKNYQNDGDSVYRLFYDTIKGRRLPLP